MSLEKARDRYLVQPGSQVKISDYDAGEKTLFECNKKSSLPVMERQLVRMKELQTQLFAQDKQKLLVVFQAMDTGGKDGCVRSVFGSVDPLGIHVQSFKRPTKKELSHDYLWRVHQHCPQNGMISVFNRSHYEDIIAVRVKSIFEEKVWERRYRHIVEFERMLAEEGTTVVKIFLRISKEEQKERLQARLDNPAKHWKFNPGDLDDRKQWDDFMGAYEDVFAKTSKQHAPWYVVPANRKWYRNLVVTQILIEAMEGMNLSYLNVVWNPNDFKIED